MYIDEDMDIQKVTVETSAGTKRAEIAEGHRVRAVVVITTDEEETHYCGITNLFIGDALELRDGIAQDIENFLPNVALHDTMFGSDEE